MEKNQRYLKQVIVIPKSLCMPTGKLAAMAAHAAMTFLLKSIVQIGGNNAPSLDINSDQWRWLTELDPGLEQQGQVSMAKIICAVDTQEELLALEQAAKARGLTVERVLDCGYSHNKPGAIAAIAVGPHWPEELEPVTGKLKLYR